MSQIVATIERDPMYVLKMALQAVQGSILEDLANKEDILCKHEYHDFYQYIVAECKSNLDLDKLLHLLEVKGVWNLHVYSENEQDLKFSQDKFGNRFHYCNGVFKP
jgi:hypothetical protein